MKNFQKFSKISKLLFLVLTILSLSACKSSNIKLTDIADKHFTSNDNGYANLHTDNGEIKEFSVKFPDYCWNKESGVIVDKNGKIFKKPHRLDAKLSAFNPYLEKNDGKTFINSESMFYENFRFELKDKYTVVDTLLNIEYVDYLSKYKIEGDDNDYEMAYKEAKELAEEYNTLVKDLETYKDQLTPKLKEAVEREIANKK